MSRIFRNSVDWKSNLFRKDNNGGNFNVVIVLFIRYVKKGGKVSMRLNLLDLCLKAMRDNGNASNDNNNNTLKFRVSFRVYVTNRIFLSKDIRDEMNSSRKHFSFFRAKKTFATFFE